MLENFSKTRISQSAIVSLLVNKLAKGSSTENPQISIEEWYLVWGLASPATFTWSDFWRCPNMFTVGFPLCNALVKLDVKWH